MKGQAARQQVGVALFPFLAVLICTMGALIVLLVLLMQQARHVAGVVAARQIGAASAAAEADRALMERVEDAQWKRDLLAKNREEKQQALADARAELAHLEDHIQRLQQQAQALLDRAQAIDAGQQLRGEDLDKARRELADLKQQAAKKKREIDEKQRQRATEQQSYALIPYAGRSGTRRRPIYLECTEFGITLQPEGLTFRG